MKSRRVFALCENHEIVKVLGFSVACLCSSFLYFQRSLSLVRTQSLVWRFVWAISNNWRPCQDTNLESPLPVHLLGTVYSKGKVEPLRTISFAGLELQVAFWVQSVQRTSFCQELRINVLEVHAWTDSITVWHWLQKPALSWTTWVANRVSVIEDISSRLNITWRHCPGCLNPAHLPSRGSKMSSVMERQWWQEPMSTADKRKWPKTCAAWDDEVLSRVRVSVVSVIAVLLVDKHLDLDSLDWEHGCFLEKWRISREQSWKRGRSVYCIRLFKKVCSVWKSACSTWQARPASINVIVKAAVIHLLEWTRSQLQYGLVDAGKRQPGILKQGIQFWKWSSDVTTGNDSMQELKLCVHSKEGLDNWKSTRRLARSVKNCVTCLCFDLQTCADISVLLPGLPLLFVRNWLSLSFACMGFRSRWTRQCMNCHVRLCSDSRC